MIENTNSIPENSAVIETAIGPLDMTEIVDGYGENEGEVTENASLDADVAQTEGEKGELQQEKAEKNEEGEKAKEATPALEKFPLPLNVYGNEVELTMEQATRAIQRGLAFDKLKEDLSQAKNDDRLLILAQIAKDTGKTSSQLLSKLHGDCLMESLEMEYGEIGNVPQEKIAQAVGKISQLEKLVQEIPLKEKQIAAKEQIAEFHRQNPMVSKIPDEVIDATKGGIPLEKAYDLYRISELEERLSEMKREITLSRQKKAAEQVETPSLSGEGSSYSLKEDDVYAFFKKMW